MTITAELWIKILQDFIDPLDYLHLYHTNQEFRQHLRHPHIYEYLIHYIEKRMKPYQVKTEEWDHRDDCGSTSLVYFLNNGQIMDSDEYNYIFQQQRDQYHRHFPWVSNQRFSW